MIFCTQPFCTQLLTGYIVTCFDVALKVFDDRWQMFFWWS